MTSASYPINADTLHKVNSISFSVPSANCAIMIKALARSTGLSSFQVAIEDLLINCSLFSTIAQNSYIKHLTLFYSECTIKETKNICTWISGVVSLLEHTKRLKNCLLRALFICLVTES